MDLSGPEVQEASRKWGVYPAGDSEEVGGEGQQVAPGAGGLHEEQETGKEKGETSVGT